MNPESIIIEYLKRIERNQLLHARILALHFRAFYGQDPMPNPLTEEERAEFLRFVEFNLKAGVPPSL